MKKSITNVLGNSKTREEVLQEIKSNRSVYPVFLDLRKEYQEQFIEFCMGVRGIKMTYDTFFKRIFNAEAHPERLSEMLSAIIGRPLTVKRALPKEHSRITEAGSLLELDIIVEFDTGEIGDVEIQKLGYLFPGQRASCYASDMVMRQYEREKSIRGEDFTYKDLKRVYTIILIENSSKEFRKLPGQYVHRGKMHFDTGIEMDFLQEFYFIPLDVFFEMKHNENELSIKNDLEAWLYFIGSDRPEEIMKVIEARPRFAEMYREVCEFRYHPEEAIRMFSDALRKLDENTVKYMIEEQKKELEEWKREVEVQKREAEAQKKEAEAQKKEAEAQKKEAEAQKKEAEAQKRVNQKQSEELEEQKKANQKQGEELERQRKEIEELRRLLAEKKE
ncbi:PD-(D/E)XK nuclease family transposase [Roseburia hominis]